MLSVYLTASRSTLGGFTGARTSTDQTGREMDASLTRDLCTLRYSQPEAATSVPDASPHGDPIAQSV
jgi:hypothetical protein